MWSCPLLYLLVTVLVRFKWLICLQGCVLASQHWRSEWCAVGACGVHCAVLAPQWLIFREAELCCSGRERINMSACYKHDFFGLVLASCNFVGVPSPMNLLSVIIWLGHHWPGQLKQGRLSSHFTQGAVIPVFYNPALAAALPHSSAELPVVLPEYLPSRNLGLLCKCFLLSVSQ